MKNEIELVNMNGSKYGVTWRDIIRTKNREHGIAGQEVIVLDLQTQQIMGVGASLALLARQRVRGMRFGVT